MSHQTLLKNLSICVHQDQLKHNIPIVSSHFSSKRQLYLSKKACKTCFIQIPLSSQVIPASSCCQTRSGMHCQAVYQVQHDKLMENIRAELIKIKSWIMGRFRLTVRDVYFIETRFKIKHADFYMRFGVGCASHIRTARTRLKSLSSKEIRHKKCVATFNRLLRRRINKW